jgi:hypothetical protein
MRSLVTLAMMVARNRQAEFKLHVRPALKNGVTLAELRALLLQSALTPASRRRTGPSAGPRRARRRTRRRSGLTCS